MSKCIQHKCPWGEVLFNKYLSMSDSLCPYCGFEGMHHVIEYHCYARVYEEDHWGNIFLDSDIKRLVCYSCGKEF